MIDMPNLQLSKGNYIPFIVEAIAFDGGDDTSASLSFGASAGSVLVFEINSANNREVFVSVNPALNATATGVQATASITLPGSGGIGPVTKTITLGLIDVTVPVDHRALVLISAGAQQPLPHP